MMPLLSRLSPGKIPVSLVLVAIGILGLGIIVVELLSYQYSSSKIRQDLSIDKQKQLELIKSELDSEVRYLENIFPAFVSSQEFQNKIIEATLSGPFFVYTPQHYGQPIDYWDRVQLLKKQIWISNYFLPLIQAEQIDSIKISLVDPHNNLIGHSSIPFIELQTENTVFFSYPVKGLFQQFHQQTLPGLDKIQLSDKYFDQILFDEKGEKTLYSAMGFNRLDIQASENKIEKSNLDKVTVELSDDQVTFRKIMALEESIYNWRSKKREDTIVARANAERKITKEFLINIRDKFDSDEIAISFDGQFIVSTLPKEILPEMISEGKIQINDANYIFHFSPYEHGWLDKKVTLAVLTNKSEMDDSSFSIYRSVVIPGIITLLLLTMTWFLIKARSGMETASMDDKNVDLENRIIDEESYVSSNFHQPFLLVEEKGKTAEIPVNSISHIRVTDHYCTVIYYQNEQWNQWMIMERLKSFEKRFDGSLVRINRSTLINPDRIDKVQLLQRKLTMEGEPENMLTISQASMDQIKEIVRDRHIENEVV